MTTIIAGILRNGRLELLEQPRGIKNGPVTVTIEEQVHENSDSADLSRRDLLRLPLAERRRILERQAEKLVNHYEADSE